MPIAFAAHFISLSATLMIVDPTRDHVLRSMYAFFPFPAAMYAITSRSSACRLSMDGSSISISFLDIEAKFSLELTADWNPVGCGVYLELVSSRAAQLLYATNVPSSDGAYGVY